MDASESPIRDLQRIAYGADSDDAERARAVDELAALAAHGVGRQRNASSAPVGSASDASGRAPSGDETDPGPGLGPRAGLRRGPATEPGAVPDTTDSGRRSTDRRRIARWAAAAASTGLVAGALLGWTAAQRFAPEAGTPLEETDILVLIEQLPVAAEAARVTRLAAVEGGIDEASVRLLASRLDGPAAYVARTSDGEDVCLVLLLPGSASRSECTQDGRLPLPGLRVPYPTEAEGTDGLAVARLDATGRIALGVTPSAE
ncbi:hypothetical protein GE115_03870 [Agromyces sp. CFH 90414]|uniref:Uncharacterized protein n=1 Tax=Agromyces agglutinans TaxID=2662258 RepID=A0A6I2FD29_9MICO|nr:hypothetical protein [Agromyces agglutinans]MRG59008.1 hypothetical protein [Agromyces agglutinans]